jgi:hypothetical protein
MRLVRGGRGQALSRGGRRAGPGSLAPSGCHVVGRPERRRCGRTGGPAAELEALPQNWRPS